MLTVCRMVLVGIGAGLPLTDDALDDLKLVLQEACASAIERTPDPGGTVEIAFRTSDAELEVSVSDHGRGAETAIGGPGFGMPLLRQLCSRLDVTPRSRNPGTVTWRLRAVAARLTGHGLPRAADGSHGRCAAVRDRERGGQAGEIDDPPDGVPGALPDGDTDHMTRPRRHDRAPRSGR